MEKRKQELLDATRDNYESLMRLADLSLPKLVTEFKDNKELLAIVLKLHRSCQELLKEGDNLIETALIATGIKYGGEYIDGVGYVVIHKTGKKVVYDNEALVDKVAATLAVDCSEPDEDGTLPHPKDAVQRAIREFAQLVGVYTKSFTGWRKRAAALLGVPVEKYREEEGGRLRVTISDTAGGDTDA